MSNSVLPSIPAKDEAQATLWSWQQTFDRLLRRGDAKIDEIVIPERLLNLGLDVTYRFGILVRESNTKARHEKDHPLLAEIIDNPEHSDEYIAARVNSLFDSRELTRRDGNPVDLKTLIHVLNGMDAGAVVDHTDRSIVASSRARAKLTLALLESGGARKDLIVETEDSIALNDEMTALVSSEASRVDALIELIRERAMRNVKEIRDMLAISSANRLMEGAL